MKKLLILMLVLGLAPAASAVLVAVAPVVSGPISWDIQGPAGFEVLIGTNATNTLNPAGYGVGYGNSPGGPQIVWGVAPPGPPAVYPNSLIGPGGIGGALPPNAGNIAFVQDSVITGFPWWGFDLGDGDVGGVGTVAGDWYMLDIIGAVSGDHIDIYDYAVSWAVPVGTLQLVPEPMTVLLLGLGGLLLRRRK